MASKYKQLRTKLPAFENEASFQEKVEEQKQVFGANPEDANLAALAARYSEARIAKGLLEEQVSDLNITLEALSQMLVEKMEAETLDSVCLSNGSTCYLSYEVYPAIKDKEALHGWCRAKKLTAMLTLPWQTLRGLCSELSLEGKPLPSGVEAYIKSAVRIRSGIGWH